MPEEDFHLSDHQRFQAHQPSLRDSVYFLQPYPALRTGLLSATLVQISFSMVGC
jgi:hypothetical protein